MLEELLTYIKNLITESHAIADLYAKHYDPVTLTIRTNNLYENHTNAIRNLDIDSLSIIYYQLEFYKNGTGEVKPEELTEFDKTLATELMKITKQIRKEKKQHKKRG